MRVVLRNRYYCDFCKKSGGSAGPMRKHEVACTLNPDRKCRMCEHTGGHEHELPQLIAILGKGGVKEMKALVEAAADCPACILAAIRQSKLLDPENLEYTGAGTAFWFDFKAECKSFWADHGRQNQGSYY